MGKLADMDVLGGFWIILRNRAALYMIQFQIRAVDREPLLVDVDTKEHIEVGIRMYGMYFFGIKNNQLIVLKSKMFVFDMNTDGSVQAE